MKIQIRRGIFETNSSSTHAISVIKNSNVTKYPKTVTFGEGFFGWEIELYTNTDDKAAYLWECMQAFENHEVQAFIKTITRILNKHKIKAIFPYNNIKENSYTYQGKTTTYTTYCDKDGKEDEGYVDHSGEAKYIVKDIISDETKLLNFLFDDNSYIATGNDNSEEIAECPDNGPAWEYDKGN